MVRPLLAVMVVLVSLCTLVAEENSLPTMPEEVTLTSGRVLRNVQVIRWEKDRVILKYSGGIDPISFSLFKSPTPSEVAALRATAKKADGKVQSPSNRIIIGQVFVTTRGAGAYKFPGAQVLILPLSALEAIKASVESEVSSAKMRTSILANFDPDPIRYRAWQDAVQSLSPTVSVTTDAEGMYRVTITAKEPQFIFCSTYRAAGAGGEYNVWAVPITNADRIDLNSANHF